MPGIYPITLDTSKNSSAAYLRATFDWHIDGCTPVNDDCPQKATVLSALQVADRGGETEFASSYAAYDALSERREATFRLPACDPLAGGEPTSGDAGPDPGTVAALAIPSNP